MTIVAAATTTTVEVAFGSLTEDPYSIHELCRTSRRTRLPVHTRAPIPCRARNSRVSLSLVLELMNLIFACLRRILPSITSFRMVSPMTCCFSIIKRRFIQIWNTSHAPLLKQKKQQKHALQLSLPSPKNSNISMHIIHRSIHM